MDDDDNMFEELDDLADEEALAIRRRAKKDKSEKVLSNIPILGFVIKYIISIFAARIQEVKRRRRSYKLALYFQFQMIVSLACFLMFFIISLQDMSKLTDTTSVPGECKLPSQIGLSNGTSIPLFDITGNLLVDNVYTYTHQERRALSCTNDNIDTLDAACTLSEMSLLLNLMMTLAIFFLVASAVCSVVFSGFKFFSNIPMESLDVDATSCKVTVLGTACRYGPWAIRALTLVIISLVVTLTILPSATHLCQGTFQRTHQCLNMYDDCAANQFKNCRYYYSKNCAGTGLPHASVDSSSFEKCKDPDFAYRFSGRMDVRLVFPTTCTRCWALHSDCKNAPVNRMRLTNDKTSSEFVFSTAKSSLSPAISTLDTELAEEIYCRCVQGLDKLGTSTGSQTSLLWDTGKLSPRSSNCTTFSSTSSCPVEIAGEVGAATYNANATVWSEYWDDAVAGTTATQSCSWGPTSQLSYFYDSQECSQTGSTLNRYVFIVSYVTVTLVGLVVLAGFSVRFTVQPETWSYSPQQKDEPWYWKLLRGIGPG